MPDLGVGGKGSPLTEVTSSPVRPPRGPTTGYWPLFGTVWPGRNCGLEAISSSFRSAGAFLLASSRREVERQANEATGSVAKEVDGLSDQMRAAMAEQEKYAAIEQAETAAQTAEPAPAAVPAPEPVSGQLSLDIPPPEAKPVSSDKT